MLTSANVTQRVRVPQRRRGLLSVNACGKKSVCELRAPCSTGGDACVVLGLSSLNHVLGVAAAAASYRPQGQQAAPRVRQVGAVPHIAQPHKRLSRSQARLRRARRVSDTFAPPR